MIKISFVSNAVLNLIVQKIKKTKRNLQTQIQFGDPVAILAQPDTFENQDIVFIHIDTLFQNYDDQTLDFFVEAIGNFAQNFKGQIIYSPIFQTRHRGVLQSREGRFLSRSQRLHNANLYAFDFMNLLMQIGIREAYNFNSGHLFQMPYTKPIIETMAEECIKMLDFLTKPENKVIITDLDNTLWGGILGEDGIENLKISQNADGIVFQEYQKFLLQKKQEGFLLAISSKNNEDDAKTAFETLNMPLKWDDFIVRKINWQPKFENIEAIAHELNLAISSFIFLDDNDFELESVANFSQNQITTFKFQNSYQRLSEIIDDYAFKRKFLSNEDLKKHQQYLENQNREKAMSQVEGFEAYLKTLEIENTLLVNDPAAMTRLSQMTEKTNQFNFNKKGFSETDLKTFQENGGLILGYTSKDKFGDYGIIALALLRFEGSKATLENMLMSCRALGKGIEWSFFDEILKHVYVQNATLEEITFVKTEKNTPALQFFEKIKNEYFDGTQFRKTTASV